MVTVEEIKKQVNDRWEPIHERVKLSNFLYNLFTNCDKETQKEIIKTMFESIKKKKD